MSLALRLKSLVDAVGADIKQLFQNYTNLANNKVVYLPMLKITIFEPTTSIPVAYTPGMIKVHQAGILLREGDDFTATTGVTLQFNYTLLAGDEIDIERISVENAPGMIAQEQTDWNATTGITSIANKPDYIAAGSTTAAARNVIDVSSRDQSLPEYYLVDAVGAYTAGGTVTLGNQIPGAATGVVWAVGKIIGVTSGGETGAVLSVIAGGTLSSVATATVKNTASNGGGGSVFARFFRYKYGKTYLYLNTSGGSYLYPDLGSSETSELWHVLADSSKVSLSSYLSTVGEVANLTTTDKSSLVNAINEVKASSGDYPGDQWTVLIARSAGITTAVTLGAQVPGAITGVVWAAGNYILDQSTGNIYAVDATGAVNLQSAFADNSNRNVVVAYGTGIPAAAQTGLRLYKKRSGVVTSVQSYLSNTSNVLHLDTATQGGTRLATVIGQMASLTTTDKSSLVAAINEVKASVGGGGGSGVSVDYRNVTIARSSAVTTAVTIGAAVPGATTGVVFAAAQTVLDETTGDIYVIGADGTITLSSAMPDNTQRIVAVAYGDGNNSSLHPGLRYYRKVSGTLTSILSTAINSNTVYHLNTTTNVASSLSTVIGQLPSLTTTEKTNLVGAINEVKANAGLPTDTWAVINARNAPISSTITLGTQIPGAPTGVNWSAGQLVLHQVTGNIHTVAADGTFTLTSAMPDNATRSVVVQFGVGSAAALAAGLKTYKKVAGVLTTNTGFFLGTSSIYHIDTASSVATDLSTVLGQLVNLTTTTKSSLVGAINEVKAATATKTLSSKSIAGSGNIDIGLRNTSSYAAFDTTVKSVTIALDTLKTTATFTTGQSVVRADKGLTLGTVGKKVYFEMTFVSGTTSGNSSVGITGVSPILTSQLGYDGLTASEVAVFQNSGNVYANAVTTSIGSGTSFATAGSVVGVAVDLETKKIWFRTNNGIWNNNAADNPQTGVGGFSITGTGDIYPAVCTDSSAVFKLNAGAEAFAFTPPTGFTEWFTSVVVDTIVPTDVEITSPVTDEVLSYNGTKWVNSKRQITVSTTAPTSPTLNQLWLDIS